MNLRAASIAVAGLALLAGLWIGTLKGGPARRTAPSESFVGFEPAELDLGAYPWGEVVPFDLTFVNRTDTPVTLADGSSSCGCTLLNKGQFVGATVGAGESLIIDSTMDMQLIPGSFARQVKLVGDAGQTWSCIVRVQVFPSWSLEPDVLDFGEVVIEPAQQPVERVLTFEADPDELMDVNAPSVDWLSVQRTDRAGTTELLVRMLPELLPAGAQSAEATVTTTSVVRPTGSVFLKARGVRELEARPASLFLVDDRVQRVEFFDRSGVRARVVRAEVGGVALRARVLDDGALELSRAVAGRVSEPVVLRVVTDGGKTRTMTVSLF